MWFLFSLVSGLLLGAGIGLYQDLCLVRGQVGFYGNEEGITREQMERFWTEGPEETGDSIEDMVLFCREERVQAQNINMGRTAEVKKTETAGGMHLAAPGRLVGGNFVTDSDSSGCVISEGAAEKLFGSRECIGGKFEMEGETYTVRGVIKGKESLCMVQGETGKAYPYIRVSAPGLPVSYVHQLLTGYLPAPYGGESGESSWISEGDLYVGIGRLAACFPAWAALIFLMLKCKRDIESLGGMKREACRIGWHVAGFAGVCALLLLSVRFSDDYVPTAWSDFSFWPELISRKAGEARRLLEEPLVIADEGMLLSLAGLAAVSVIGTAVLVCVIRPDNSNK